MSADLIKALGVVGTEERLRFLSDKYAFESGRAYKDPAFSALLAGRSEGYAEAADMVLNADLVPRAEVVAWLEAEARDEHDCFGTHVSRLPTGAAEVRENELTAAAEALKAGNPWEDDE